MSTQSKSGGCLGTIGVAFIFLLVGGGLCFWGWNILQDARASASWPTAVGLITRSEVTESTDAEGGDSYSPEVTYTYQVNSLSYVGNRIKFGENSYNSRNRAQEIAANYPVNKEITVFYEPTQPDNSVLEAGVSSGSYIVLAIGALFVFLTVLMIPIALLTRRSRR
ncbi:MAG: DUF3592 domain-containing protein [Ardenticatenaceae bacterium]|nr:DUF3592 domain-containing protein [Ardenticatenaceae bacterium]